MAKNDSFTIHTQDLQKVMNALVSKNTGRVVVKMIDDNGYIIVRDSSDFLIASIKKSEPQKTNP
jgi:hypothetical protein